MKTFITILICLLICCSIAFAGKGKARVYDQFWMENDKKLRTMEKNCSQYESMQKDYDRKVWKNENEKQLYINKMNQLHEECKKLKEELLKTVKLKYTFRPYIQTDPYQKWLEFSEEQRKEKNEEFQTWFKTLSDQEKLENKTELYHIFSYEDNRLKNELLKCDDLDCRMKYSAYLSTLQKWFKIIDEIE